MSNEWKPGDVAMVTWDDAPAAVHAQGRHDVKTEIGLRTASGWALNVALNHVRDDAVADAHPLVVIDPARLTWDGRTPSAQEFTEWAESLPAGEFATGILIIADALRDLPPVIVPKPDEPTGLGAVVEDVDGVRWVRVCEHGDNCNAWRKWNNAVHDIEAAPAARAFYADIAAARVLSEGVRDV